MKNKNIFSWMNPKLSVRETEKYGKGIYSESVIKKDECVAILGGHIYNIEYEKKLPEKIKDNGIQISDELILGIINESEIEDAIYFNHSCDPNIGIKGQIFLVAMKNINKNKQLYFDYAMTLGGKEKYSMDCLCGSLNCRGKITNNDWKIPVLQKKYKGYFQWYIEEKIKKLKKK
jgi:hypothetical protein